LNITPCRNFAPEALLLNGSTLHHGVFVAGDRVAPSPAAAFLTASSRLPLRYRAHLFLIQLRLEKNHAPTGAQMCLLSFVTTLP
jgi:hypothetical protein